jgi:hypothetical protein
MEETKGEVIMSYVLEETQRPPTRDELPQELPHLSLLEHLRSGGSETGELGLEKAKGNLGRSAKGRS